MSDQRNCSVNTRNKDFYAYFFSVLESFDRAASLSGIERTQPSHQCAIMQIGRAGIIIGLFVRDLSEVRRSRHGVLADIWDCLEPITAGRIIRTLSL